MRINATSHRKCSSFPFCARRLLLTAAIAAIGAPLSQPLSLPLDIRTFVSGQTVVICDSSRIFVWRGDARTLGGITLSDSIAGDRIIDIAESEGSLWINALSGIASIALSSGTVERIAPPVAEVARTRITADIDYVWLLSPDSLRRYDKLSREWFAFALPGSGSDAIGVYSDGDIVYCMATSLVRRFSIQEEKWTTTPMPGFTISPQARFFVNGPSLVAVDGARILRYVIASQSWDKIDAGKEIVDVRLEPDRYFYLTSSGAYLYKTDASVSQALDIPGATGAACLAAAGDTVFLATERTIVKYSLAAKTSDNLDYSQRMQGAAIAKIMQTGSLLGVLSSEQWSIYDPISRIWEEFALASSRPRRAFASWDEQNGAKIRYGPTVYSQLRGSATQDIKLVFANKDSAFVRFSDTQYVVTDTLYSQRIVADTVINGISFTDTIINDTLISFRSVRDTLGDTTLAKPLYWGNTLPVIDVTLHTQFADDRYLDLHFDNSNVSRPPDKYFYYRGNKRDRLAWLRGGTNTFELPQSLTLPQTRFEGGAVAIESKSTLRERDRKVVRTQAGAGFITAQTRHEVVPYSEEGIYRIFVFTTDTSSNVAVVPGSMRITIDGEDVDTANYIFSAVTGDIRFLREDILDPTSVIRVSYQLQTVPENVPRDVEFVPSSHFGDIEYVTAAVSPASWITAQGGYLSVGPGSAHRDALRRHIIHAAVPLEFRKANPDLFVRASPEFSFAAASPSWAGGIGLQGRLFKNTSLLFNGLVAESSFVAADNLSKGYGYVKHETDFTLAHNFLPEIPISYYQHDRFYANGDEHRYEFNAGVHFVKFPFADLTLSRNRVDTIAPVPLMEIDSLAVSPDTAIDSMAFRRLKDKMQLRLYEMSSPFFEKLLHLNKFNYDFSYTLFGTLYDFIFDPFVGERGHTDTLGGNGHIWFGRLTLCPLSSIALTGQTLVRRNPKSSFYALQYDPSLLLQTYDWPLGLDFTAGYTLRFSSSDRDTLDTSAVYIERSLGLVMRPGSWLKMLSWFSPRIGVSQTVFCEFSDATPRGDTILFGAARKANRLLSPSIGLRIFPNSNITFQNDNTWTLGDSTEHFATFNDLKWYFGANRLSQTRWEYDREIKGWQLNAAIPRHYHRAWTRYEHAWTNWMKTATAIASSYKQIDSIFEDSTVNLSTGGWDIDTLVVKNGITRTGPEFGVDLSFQKISVIKKLLNNHSFSLFWQNSHGRTEPAPEISYSVFLKAIFTPNVSLHTNNTFSWKKGSLDQYSGTVSAALLF